MLYKSIINLPSVLLRLQPEINLSKIMETLTLALHWIMLGSITLLFNYSINTYN